MWPIQCSFIFNSMASTLVNLRLLKDFSFGNEIIPVDVEHGMETALVEALKEVVLVDDQRF